MKVNSLAVISGMNGTARMCLELHPQRLLSLIDLTVPSKALLPYVTPFIALSKQMTSSPKLFVKNDK
jgi:hypothetical protein